MNIENQKVLAEQLQKLHKQDEMFVIPNIWNPGSAVIFQKQGFKAVATTSAGIAYSLGYPDGEDIEIEDLVGCVSRITKRLEIPLSVDFERGYSEDIDVIKNNAMRLLAAGAVGFNIEDGKIDGTLDEIALMEKKIRTLVEIKRETGINFVINARTCTYWLDVADDDNKIKIAIERGNAYKRAGADCIFIPGVMSRETVEKLLGGIDSPVNIILNPKYNDFEGLSEMGVRRLSVGSGPVRSSLNFLIEMAEDLNRGKIDKIVDHKFTYGEANRYFENNKSNKKAGN